MNLNDLLSSILNKFLRAADIPDVRLSPADPVVDAVGAGVGVDTDSIFSRSLSWIDVLLKTMKLNLVSIVT